MVRSFAILLCSALVFAAFSDEVAPVRFEDQAAAAGLKFVLDNFPTAEKHIIESMPGGTAAFDYNGDGRTDVFFTNGASIPSLEKDSPRFYNRLFRNDGNLHFSDVTLEAGLAGAGYSMGAAAADFDNDGHVDLFAAGVFRNLLYRNRGDGSFEEISRSAGIKSDRWSVAGGWFDYDNDGFLDLLVVNYAHWSTDYDRFCGDRARNIRVYCHPKYYDPVPNALYRNRGDGTFEDVSEAAGIGSCSGRGMSVAFADYDRDGWIDAFVSNDNLPNFLFRNRGDGTFEEAGLLSGAALLNHGKPVASMGVDFRDYDNDGWPDIAVTALTGETYPLFRNEGDGFFRDVTYPSGIGSASSPLSGWSNGFFDFNNDGWKDLFTANSHVNDRIELFEATSYRQPNSVFLNLGGGRFADRSAAAGESFQLPHAHRGSAFADFDGDGRIDVVVTALGAPAELWRNAGPHENRWLILRLQGTRSNRDGIGTRIRIGDQHNLMTSSVGYASSSHFGVHFGLGGRQRVELIEIHWPSGIRQELSDIETNRVIEVTEP